MDPRILAFALLGAALGLAADRLSARWPSDADDPPRRGEAGRVGLAEAPVRTDTAPRTTSTRSFDRRTGVTTLWGALAFGALAARWTEPRDLLLLGVYFAALTVLLATDLDRRILPDRITLPLISLALLALLAGVDPLLRGRELALASGLIAGLVAPVLLLATSVVLRGGIGVGDLKLAAGLGLLSGASRLFVGFIVASAASSIVLVTLLATRRIRLHSPIPFGPVLIAAGMIAAVLP